MKTTTIHLPADTPIINLATFAWRNGYDLYATRSGSIEFRARAASNFNRIPRAHMRMQAPLWRRGRK